MNILQQTLDDREDRRQDEAAAEERWLRERAGIDPAIRLQSWDRWLRARLRKTLLWPSEPAASERLMSQCAVEMTTLAKQLYGRGWMLDGKALADLVNAVLEPIGKAQRGGKVGDFWPYFRASVKRYVGANAEQLQQFARRTGADVGTQSIGGLLAGLGIGRSNAADNGPSMTELLARRAGEVAVAKAETLRERQARLRAVEKADVQQGKLL